MESIVPEIKKRIHSFLVEEKGQISKYKFISLGAFLGSVSMLSLIPSVAAAHTNNFSVSWASGDVTARHGHHTSHASHASHASHSSHASHASHSSHGSHASHSSHASHASHGSHASHASHGSHASHASHGSHASHASHASHCSTSWMGTGKTGTCSSQCSQIARTCANACPCSGTTTCYGSCSGSISPCSSGCNTCAAGSGTYCCCQ